MTVLSAISALFKYRPVRIYTTLSPAEVRHCIQRILHNENPLQRKLEGQIRIAWFELMLKEDPWSNANRGNVSVKGELEEAEDGGTFITVTEFSFIRSEIGIVMLLLLLVVFGFTAYNQGSWELALPMVFMLLMFLLLRKHKSSNYYLLTDIIKYALQEEEQQLNR